MIPPNFVHMSPHTPHRVPGKILYTLTLYREYPGRSTARSIRRTQKCTSAPYPYPLALSGLALPYSDCLLFLHCLKLSLTLPSIFHSVNKNQLFHTEYPEMSVIFPFHRASRTMSDSDSQKRINAFRQIHLLIYSAFSPK